MPEKIWNSEASSLFLTEREQKLVDSLSEEHKETLRHLLSPNLTSKKKQIVGIRSEDLLYFLECVQRGYIPVSQDFTLRGKIENDCPVYHLSINPDSEKLAAEHSEYLEEFSTEESFEELAEHNVRLYGHAGIPAGIYRNIFPAIKDMDAFYGDLAERYHHTIFPNQETISAEEIANKTSRALLLEELMEEVTGTLLARKISPFSEYILKTGVSVKASSVIIVLAKHIDAAKMNLGEYSVLLNNLRERTGICVAFNNDTLEKFKVETRELYIDSGNELIIRIPDGKLPISCVQGFETMGNFEDELLESLGVE